MTIEEGRLYDLPSLKQLHKNCILFYVGKIRMERYSKLLK